MVRRVDRYLWGELLPPFGVALLAFLVFIGLELVLSLSDVFLARGVGAGTMLRLLSLKLPSLITLALPASVMLATFLALGRLVSDRELLALQAVGYSMRRVLLPFVVFGIGVSGLAYLVGELAVPAAEAAYRSELLTVLYRGEVPAMQEHVFFRGSEGELYYIQSYEEDRALGIVVYDLSGRVFPPQSPFPTVLTAESGRFRGGDLTLEEGRLLRFGQDGVLEEMTRFRGLTLEVGEDVQQAVLGGKTPGEMSLRELSERIDLFVRSGLDPRHLVVEYHSKLAVIAAAAVFALVGAPLGVLLGRRGRAVAAIAGFMLVAGAQGMQIWSRTMARRGMLPASLGGWLPHIVLAVVGVLLLLWTDRRRTRGVTTASLLVVLVACGVGAVDLPFEEMTAERMVLGAEGASFTATGVLALLPDYELSADHVEGVREEGGWRMEVRGAQLVGLDMELHARRISARFDEQGRLKDAVAEVFEGSSGFEGPEKDEVLRFAGDWGRASFQGGALSRLEARDVQFTTCPCLEGAPYSAEAARFVLLPRRWLYAQNVTVLSFGLRTGWLPVYAARLGEEASPMFPEIGREAGEWFMRWFIPWTLHEELWGAVGMTWFPWAGRADPSLDVVWEAGELRLTMDAAEFSAHGEASWGGWRTRLSLAEERVSADVSGDLGPWTWSTRWGRVESEGELLYERLPHGVVSGTIGAWWGGQVGVRLDAGRFVEGEYVDVRSGVSLNWARTWELDTLTLRTPLGVGVDVYRRAQRVTLETNPELRLSGLRLSYRGRISLGSSPFSFDAAPPMSRVTLGLVGRSDDWTQQVSFAWDVIGDASLSGTWSLRGPGVRTEFSFSPVPLAFERGTWELSWSTDVSTLSLRGGATTDPWQWDDLLLRGAWADDALSMSGGVRVGVVPWVLKRTVGEVRWELGDTWSTRLSGEYDWVGGRWVQLGVDVGRLFQGCLRVGVQFDLSGIRLLVEVPAFAKARVVFAPQDEGLRIGN